MPSKCGNKDFVDVNHSFIEAGLETILVYYLACQETGKTLKMLTH